MPQVEGRDPALWWLDFELPKHRYDEVLSMVKVRDFWLMTTTYAVWKFSVNHDGKPCVQIAQEL